MALAYGAYVGKVSK